MNGDRTRSRGRSGGTGERSATDETGSDGGLGEVGSTLDGQDRPTGRGGIGRRISDRASALFSLEVFLAALSMSAGGLVATTTSVPVPGAGLIGLFAGTFLLAVFLKGRHFTEATLAGAIVGATSVLVGFTVVDPSTVALLAGLGYWLVAIGAVLGGWVALVGSYLGRDLRYGLTREL